LLTAWRLAGSLKPPSVPLSGRAKGRRRQLPNRIVREGILTSDRIDQLDAAAEVFYRRLMSKVDDHGLYDARPSILRSSLYPLRVDRVREADITRWIAACEKAGVIALYEHQGKPLLQMLDTRWAARSEPKYPLPTSASNCAQVPSAAPVVVVVDVSEDVDPADAGKPSRKGRKTAYPVDFHPDDTGQKLCTDAGFVVADEVGKFRNHHEAQGTVMSNWQAGFRTWIDKAKGFRKPWQTPASVTVPSKPGRDPALVKLEQDSLKAAKPAPEVQARMDAILKGKVYP
jgi:hypothetical protein